MTTPGPHPPNTEGTKSEAKSVPSHVDDTITSPKLDSAIVPVFGPPVVMGEVGQLGPYRIVKELGHGGMGAVYAAIDTRLDRRLALKVMLPKFAADTAARERFLREARAVARIKHDNVVTVYEADERDGVPYIAMEFLEGYPLDEFLRRKGNPTVMQVLKIAAETAAGLSAAHHLGLVHRDIKPANLWLEAPQGRVKVLDFGLAKPIDNEIELTKSGAIVGTPAYMSPEQARGSKVDHRSDLFSLGAVMYRLCTGQLPFQGINTMAVLMALGTEEPAFVRERNPEVPESLATLIHQLLAKQPERRPTDADEVVRRLRQIARGERDVPLATAVPQASQPQATYVPMAVTAASEANPFADIDVESNTEIAAPKATPTPHKPARRGKAFLLGSLGLLVVLMVVGVLVIVKYKDGLPNKADRPDNPAPAVPSIDHKTLAKTGPEKKNPEVSDPERKAAEYVLAMRGRVRINDQINELRSTPELPNEPFTLTMVRILSNRAVNDAGLAHFKTCKELKILSLQGSSLTDKGLVHFSDCTRLISLHLGSTATTDGGLTHFSNSKSLSELHLSNTKIKGEGMVHLKDCRLLTLLYLNDTPFTDDGLVHLKNNRQLQTLSLNGTAITDLGIGYLKDLSKLTTLCVQRTNVTAKGIAELRQALPNCRVIHNGGVAEPVANSDPDRRAAEYVCSVGGSVQTDASPGMITDAVDLPTKRFMLIKVNLANNMALTNEGLIHCQGCKTMIELDLSGTSVTDDGLAYFNNCKKLTLLHLTGTKVTDRGLAHFSGCHELQALGLNDTVISDNGMAHFRDCTKLTRLQIGGTLVGNDGLANFRKCKELTQLNLYGTKVSDEGLAHFKGCTQLEWLHLGGTATTDTGLANFKNCSRLNFAYVRQTKVTLQGVQQLHEAIPACKIEHDGGVLGPKAFKPKEILDRLTSADWEWTTPTLLGPKFVNLFPDIAPSLTQDGLALVCTISNPGASSFVECRRATKDEPFGDPIPLKGFPGQARDGNPFISADGLTLVYSSLKLGAPANGKAHNIWMVQRPNRDAPWGQPQALPEPVNATVSTACPSLSADGLTIYFNSRRAFDGNSGSARLWMAKRPRRDALFDPPVYLGPEINGESNHADPVSIADGTGLLFTRYTETRGNATSTGSLFVALKQDDGKWKVQSLDIPGAAPTKQFDRGPAFDPETMTLIFASDRPGGHGKSNLWVTRRVPKQAKAP